MTAELTRYLRELVELVKAGTDDPQVSARPLSLQTLAQNLDRRAFPAATPSGGRP